jgi:hypothetical protein
MLIKASISKTVIMNQVWARCQDVAYINAEMAEVCSNVTKHLGHKELCLTVRTVQ